MMSDSILPGIEVHAIAMAIPSTTCLPCSRLSKCALVSSDSALSGWLQGPVLHASSLVAMEGKSEKKKLSVIYH